jgi:hypothetical protein
MVVPMVVLQAHEMAGGVADRSSVPPPIGSVHPCPPRIHHGVGWCVLNGSVVTSPDRAAPAEQV